MLMIPYGLVKDMIPYSLVKDMIPYSLVKDMIPRGELGRDNILEYNTRFFWQKT